MTLTRALSRTLAVLFSLALIAGLAPPDAARAAGPPRVHPRLLEEAERHPDKLVRVIVTRQHNDRSADRQVASKGRRKVKDVATVGFVAEIAGRDVAELGKHPAVKYIAPDAPMRRASVDDSRLAPLAGQVAYQQAIGATSQWKAGLTGKGIGVAVVDTGINRALPDFSDGAGGSRVVATQLFSSSPTPTTVSTSPTPVSTSPTPAPTGPTPTPTGPSPAPATIAVAPTADAVGHGTHVAGIIGGNSWTQPDPALQGKYIGVAPEVNLIDLRVSDDSGQSYLSDVVNAIEWAITNRQTYNIRVLNLSLVSTVGESASTNVLAAAVERAWFSGIFVVVASGNQGPDSALYAPANDPFVLAVGAADTLGTAGEDDDGVAWWSSYGLTQDGYGRPDLVAPGRWIPSTLASASSVLATQHPDRIVDGGYIWMSGTSMAAPVVAGTAALILQAHPEYTNDVVKWLLTSTATRLPATVGSGAGEVNASAALGYTGPLGAANDGLPISLQLVTPNGATTYATTSWSSTSWSSTSWSSTSWSSTSWSTSSWSTSSWSTSSWTAGAATVAPWASVDYP
ncbi:MAG TPA: S8 family peptidase [Chloroflexota bacterium]|jgi:serine protease AprX|nr:S8 family peptidase [Chloroflexota bacterium]